VKLQGRFSGFETDDLIVSVKSEDSQQECKLLAQVKHSVSLSESDTAFAGLIRAAWNDFNNAALFARQQDVIALITGPLSKADISDVRPLLERARHSESASEFFRRFDLAKFTSNGQRQKLQVFRSQLREANDGRQVADEEVFQFLRHFHLLGYDLDIRAGVTLSLLHSLIGQTSAASAAELWALVVAEVQDANKNAGTLTAESVGRELRDAFAKRVEKKFPSHFTVPGESETGTGAAKYADVPELLVANLLGSWDEKVEADRALVEALAEGAYDAWIRGLRKVLQRPLPPLSLKDGKWQVNDRVELWAALGSRVFDSQLDLFKSCAVNVLAESDPKFELPAESRYAAQLYGKTLRFSKRLRTGLAESLALLTAHDHHLTFCSRGKSEGTAILAVREVLTDADWVRWASVNDLLPLLAEAATGEFLAAVEDALKSAPCPFDALFAQETEGVAGATYLSGLLWALETIAWSPDHFGRAMLCLGELAARDPGGRWANRPANSLTCILLPWFPQTCAKVEQRSAAIAALMAEWPAVGWKLILSLLPGARSASTGTQKPKWWKVIPDDRLDGVSKPEYWDQIERYSAMAVAAAKADRGNLDELVAQIPRLHPAAYEELLEYLGSGKVVGLPEGERFGVWEQLVQLLARHRKYADAGWAMSPEQTERLAAIAGRLAPEAAALRHRRLFSGRETELFEERGSYEAQYAALEKQRREAIEELLASSGLKGVLEFVSTVESPTQVGVAFGGAAHADEDVKILPDLLGPPRESVTQFCEGFCWGRFSALGWTWVDGIDKAHWAPEQVGRFFALLPFSSAAWERVERVPGSERVYWSACRVHPRGDEADLPLAVERLVSHGRSYAAVTCLDRMIDKGRDPEVRQAVMALLAAVHSEEPPSPLSSYEIARLITYLQDCGRTDPSDLFGVEWAYLPLLEQERDAWPKFLNWRLAEDPSFFCKVIRLVFRSRKESEPVEDLPDEAKERAANAYRLLSAWRVPPGVMRDGGLDAAALDAWLEVVKAECAETGHLEIAMSIFGQVLVHAPSDPDGLWIHRSAAEILNARDASDARDGFRTALFNSRGAHWVDPEGAPEREIAKKYRAQADAAETAGFQRLAATLRELATSYVRQADWIAARQYPGD